MTEHVCGLSECLERQPASSRACRSFGGEHRWTDGHGGAGQGCARRSDVWDRVTVCDIGVRQSHERSVGGGDVDCLSPVEVGPVRATNRARTGASQRRRPRSPGEAGSSVLAASAVGLGEAASGCPSMAMAATDVTANASRPVANPMRMRRGPGRRTRHGAGPGCAGVWPRERRGSRCETTESPGNSALRNPLRARGCPWGRFGDRVGWWSRHALDPVR